MGGFSQNEKLALMKMIERNYHGGLDINYIKSVLFPEQYIADVPQNLTNLAFCRFTDKQQVTINSGGSTDASAGVGGTGMLIWYPKVTAGPSLFYYYSEQPLKQTGGYPFNSITSTSVTPVGSTTAVSTKIMSWRLGGVAKYPMYFQQANLVSAAL